MKFEALTKYIHKLGDPQERLCFINDFAAFSKTNPHYGLPKFKDILSESGLEWTTESMRGANPAEVGAEAVLALIYGTIRADQLSSGVLEGFVEEGTVYCWLDYLKLSDEVSDLGMSIAYIEISVDNPEKGSSKLVLEKNRIHFESRRLGRGQARHSYRYSPKSPLAKRPFELLEACLKEQDWHDAPAATLKDKTAYRLLARYGNGKEVRHEGLYDRAHVPEQAFISFIHSIYDIIDELGLNDVLSLGGFRDAPKKGEIKCCGVEFSRYGKLYHYLAGSVSVKKGDTVLVRVGQNGYEREAIVREVVFYRWDEAPYALEQMKEIIKVIEPHEDDIILQIGGNLS